MPPHNQLGSTGSIQNQLPIRKAQIHNSVKKPKVCPYNTIWSTALSLIAPSWNFLKNIYLFINIIGKVL